MGLVLDAINNANSSDVANKTEDDINDKNQHAKRN